MTNEIWKEDTDAAVAKVEALPNDASEQPWFIKFWRYLIAQLGQTVELGKAFGESEIAKREADALRTTQEACHIAANAKSTDQQVVSQFVANMRNIEELQSKEAQLLSLAKVMEENPGLSEQLEKLKNIVSDLEVTRGLRIEAVEDQETRKPDTD